VTRLAAGNRELLRDRVAGDVQLLKGGGLLARSAPLLHRDCAEAALSPRDRAALDVGELACERLGPSPPSVHARHADHGHETEAIYRRDNIVTKQDIRAARIKTQIYI
jgi:hypothetical protein